MIMVDANENVWERRWFVLRRCVDEGLFLRCAVEIADGIRCRPYLHMYAHSNEVEETGVINLNGVNIERNPEMEALLGVRTLPPRIETKY